MNATLLNCLKSHEMADPLDGVLVVFENVLARPRMLAEQVEKQ